MRRFYSKLSCSEWIVDNSDLWRIFAPIGGDFYSFSYAEGGFENPSQ
jgi:hypothetical protein